jgi:hypothetical protein
VFPTPGFGAPYPAGMVWPLWCGPCAGFWHVPLQSMWRADFEYQAKEPLAVNLNIDTSMAQDPLVRVSA